MLRSLVLVLLLVNAGFYAWTHGWLNGITGVQPESQREPQRLSQQVHPDKLILVPSAASAAAADAAASSASALAASANATVCLEAGPFDSGEDTQVAEALRAQLPTGSWTTDTVAVPGEWLLYMGPFPDPDMLARKIIELKRVKTLTLEEVQSPPALAHGLSLGKFNRQDEAVAALDLWRNRGIRTARVVTARPPMELQVIRVPQATSKMQIVLGGIKLPSGKEFVACRP